MQFVYPQSVLTHRLPDELFQEEAKAISLAGHSVSLVDSEKLQTKSPGIRPPFDAGATVVYRGWMLTPVEYKNLVRSVTALGGMPFISTEQYLSTHYLPNWYKRIADLTPETVVLQHDSDWLAALAELGWPRFFVKDFVKSLKTSVGSVIDRPDDIHVVVAEMEKYRGMVEGGLCIRRVEDFLPDTERRYFVLNSKAYGSDPRSEIPEIVVECANRIESKFFSVDVVVRSDGELRIIEVGDGQVSDLVGWSVERFACIWENVG
jgi:hypothetical protein